VLENECQEELKRIEKNRNGLDQHIINAVLPKDEDVSQSNTIIEVRAGIGGDEVSLLACELLQCYAKIAKIMKWKVEDFTSSKTDLGGIQEATISISGGATLKHPSNLEDNGFLIGPYGVFKFESGLHRVQRVPVNDSRIHTSACSVAVLPLSNTGSTNNGLLLKSELKIETMFLSGAGGQHINTTNSAVQITHIPTGITASIQDESSQHKNKERALQLITAWVRDRPHEEEDCKLGVTHISIRGGGDRSEQP
jgi:peptide chain release factor 1